MTRAAVNPVIETIGEPVFTDHAIDLIAGILLARAERQLGLSPECERLPVKGSPSRDPFNEGQASESYEKRPS